MPIIRMPDGQKVRFSDDMPKEQIRDMIATKFMIMYREDTVLKEHSLRRFMAG